MAHLIELLGVEVIEQEEGHAVVRVDVDDRHLNPGGTVHGGCVATIVDTAMGTALWSDTDEGERPVTIDLHVTFLAPGKRGPLTATANLRKHGKRITVVEAEVTQPGDDGQDQVIALADGTFTTVG